MGQIRYQETKYGFIFGAATVSRLISDKKDGWVYLAIKGGNFDEKKISRYKNVRQIEIYVTKSGKIRVFSNLGELVPKRK